MPTINQLIRHGRQRPLTRNKVPSNGGVSPKARGLHACLYDDAEKAELGFAESCACAFKQRL